MTELACKALLFDLDGVLVDSTLCVERHWREWADKHKLDMAAILQVHSGRRTEETMRVVAPHLQAETEAAQFAEIEAVDTEGVFEIEGAGELLRALPTGTWAIVTSGPERSSRARLERVGLPIPDVIVTGQDVKNGKPDPEPYRLAAARLGLAPADCIVIEDAPAGIQAGRAAGMRVIAVAFSHQPQDLAGAEVVAASLADISVQAASSDSSAALIVRVKAS